MGAPLPSAAAHAAVAHGGEPSSLWLRGVRHLALAVINAMTFGDFSVSTQAGADKTFSDRFALGDRRRCTADAPQQRANFGAAGGHPPA